MATVNTSPVRKAVETAMDDLLGRIREEANYRGKVASGGTLSALRTPVVSGEGYVLGTLTGPDHWKYVGNGRGPGRMPPITRIEAWIASKALPISAWAVAKRIAKEGSRDFRLGRTNIFLDSIDAWKESDAVDAVGQAGVLAFGAAYVQNIKDTFKPLA